MTPKYNSRFDDPNHPLLGPNICGLKYWGLWQPTRFHAYLYNTIHVAVTILFVSQYVELWIIRHDLGRALRNLSVSMLSTVCICKTATFVFWHRPWRELMEFVSHLEKRQLAKNDPETNAIIGAYTKYSRKLTFFYWCLVAATGFTVILAPLLGVLSSPEHRERIRNATSPYPEIISSWVPFDKTRGFGYCVACFIHFLICLYGGGVLASYDSNAVVIMVFFAGQLDLLSINCAKLFIDDNDEVVSQDIALKRIKEYHHQHSNLIKFSTLLNSLMSPNMFMYVVMCSLTICASAVQLTMEDSSIVQRVLEGQFVIALVAQLLLYCWHSNEVLYMSNTVDNGVYSSTWWSQNVRVRRSVLLLSGKLRRPIVFTAGPFTELNLATFVAILKGTYSYFTLFSSNAN